MQVRSDSFSAQGIPPFPEKTERLVRELRSIESTLGGEGLRDLWRVNDKLLAENLERLREFSCVSSAAQLDDPVFARRLSPALFSYVGIQYKSMAPDVLDAAALDWLQGHLWVLSGLYGCLRPYDAVQPYRLEMGARLAVDGARDLYAFWGSDIAEAVCGAAAGLLGDRTAVVNLASVEYSKAVVPQLPGNSLCVSIVFGEELRGGKPVQRATASKIARGSMVRWMAERAVGTVEELTRFDVGYAYASKLSSVDGARRTLVFMKS